MLLVADSSSCGIANYNTRGLPIGVARADCAKGYYSFGHEIGHIFGATHNRLNAGGADYEYSYGWLIQPKAAEDDEGYRTIMA